MKEKPFLERWHGAHHYPDKVHVLLVLFLFLTIVALFLSYFTFNKSVYSNINYTSPTPTPQASIAPTPTATPTPAPLTPTFPANPTITTPIKHPQQVACTMEAKLCPDGKTYVSRHGPNCEFSKCPTK